MGRKMKKRLLLGFICAVILFIVVITRDDDFAQIIVPILGSFSERDINCYNEASDISGLQEFDPSRGMKTINLKYVQYFCFHFWILIKGGFKQMEELFPILGN